MNQPMDVLLPQTGAARLLTAVTRCDAQSVTAVGEIGAAHPLVQGRAAPALLALEMGAQAAAAMEAIARLARPDAGPVRGRLVRVREARFLRPSLPVEAPLTVTARLTALAPPLAVYHITVSIEGVEGVTATLSTYAAGEAAGS